MKVPAGMPPLKAAWMIRAMIQVSQRPDVALGYNKPGNRIEDKLSFLFF